MNRDAREIEEEYHGIKRFYLFLLITGEILMTRDLEIEKAASRSSLQGHSRGAWTMPGFDYITEKEGA